MTLHNTYTILGLSLIAQHSLAGGVGLGTNVGDPLSLVVGSALPLGIGGIAGIAAISLIIGIQLIKRKK